MIEVVDDSSRSSAPGSARTGACPVWSPFASSLACQLRARCNDAGHRPAQEDRRARAATGNVLTSRNITAWTQARPGGFRRSLRSSLKGRGRSTPFRVGELSLAFFAACGRAGIGVGVQDRPAGPTAERPEVLDVDAARRTLLEAEKEVVERSLLGRGRGSGACSRAGVPVGGQAPVGRRSSLRRCRARHGVLRQGSWWARSINGATTPRARGGHDQHDPRPPQLAVGSCRRVAGPAGWCGRGQAADAVVTQPVEDQLGQLPGGGDHADVAAPALRDPVADLPEPGVAPTRCTASTAAQRTRRLPCLVIGPRCTVVSDS